MITRYLSSSLICFLILMVAATSLVALADEGEYEQIVRLEQEETRKLAAAFEFLLRAENRSLDFGSMWIMFSRDLEFSYVSFYPKNGVMAINGTDAAELFLAMSGVASERPPHSSVVIKTLSFDSLEISCSYSSTSKPMYFCQIAGA